MTFQLKPYRGPDFDAPALKGAPDAKLEAAPLDGVAPEDFHAMSIWPEYFKIGGRWLLAEESRMDCVPVYSDGMIEVTEPRRLHRGDLVICGRTEDGSEGIYVHPTGFEEPGTSVESFAFRQRRSRETAFTRDYDELYDLLRYEREHGNIVWVMGPAFAFDRGARDAFARLVRGGYAHAVLAGNALATHDLEAAWLGTALGQDIYTQQNRPNGHYHHLQTINRVRRCGSIPAFLEAEGITDGIVAACHASNVPMVLAGSIRDDGPLPGVIGDVYAAQDAMRLYIRRATTVICMATMLHTIAAGNMVPSYRVTEDGTVRQVYFYVVDISEFAAGKLADRGSLSSRSILTNVQDFIVNVAGKLGV
ncbi:MAG: hypothetical protein IJ573_02120 [Clostridia bacterium]|nr:hypothetical protein [Clostridia bacterium]